MTCELLNSCDAAWLQAAIGETLSDIVTLRNPGTATRGAGGGVVAGAIVDTAGVSARLQQSGFSGDTRAVVDRLELINPAIWHFAYTQSGVTEKTQIIFGTRVFNVRSVDKDGALGIEQVAITDEVR